MVNNEKTNREINVARLVGKMRIVQAISMSGLVLLSVALLRAQQSDSTSNQASSTDTATSMATVPAGTRMMVKMIDPVDSEKNRVNDRFRGSLEANLMAGDVVVAPRGTTVYGRLVNAQPAGRTAGAELELDLTDIMIDDHLHSLTTSPKQIQGEEGEAPASTARSAGTGAAVGAVTGAGVGLGAGVGAIAGQVRGGTTRGEKVNVPADALIEFTLEHPVSLPMARK